MDTVCPSGIVNVAKSFLAECNKFLVIGTSGRDDDLLDLLSSSVQAIPQVSVHIVDVAIDEVAKRYEKVVPFAHGRIQRHARGFRKFMLGPELSGFLRE